jgi:hypothetical protein
MFLRSRVGEIKLGLVEGCFMYSGKEEVLYLKNSLDSYNYSPGKNEN